MGLYLAQAVPLAHADAAAPDPSGRLLLLVVGLPVGAALLAWLLLTILGRAGRRNRGNEVMFGVAALSVGAGLVHAAVTREHFDEHVAYGTFFATVASAQIIWPVWVIRTRSRAALTIGLVGTAGIVAIWVVSRTLGLPVGPEAFEPERVGVSDGLATACEAGVAFGCVLLLRGRRYLYLVSGAPTCDRVRRQGRSLSRTGQAVRLDKEVNW